MRISTEEARRLGLSGHDVFLLTHLMYRDQLHRDFCIVTFAREAMLALHDSILISSRHELRAYSKLMQEFLESGGLMSPQPMPRSIAFERRMEYQHFEMLKIGCGLELWMRAKLVENGVVVHQLSRNEPTVLDLAKLQYRQPVLCTEMLERVGFVFNGQRNVIPCLTDRTVQFSTLTRQAKYRTASMLPERLLDVVDGIRQLRNQIHLPGDPIDVPALHNLDLLGLLTDIINSQIVPMANAAIERSELRFPPFVEVEAA